MAVEAHSQDAPGGAVDLGEFLVFPGRPLAQLRVGANAAYHAEASDGAPADAFAIVCDRASMPRLEAMPTLRKIEATGVLLPQAWRIVDWPPSGQRHLVAVFRKPAGGRLIGSVEEAVTPLSEEEAIRQFLVPVVSALRQMHAAGIVHGSVNPTNLFFADGTRRRLTLGDCVTAGTASLQPASCAPIELAMAAPRARGLGQTGDDVFGLGATLVFLLLGRNPVAGVAEEELLAARIDGGSYTVLLAGNRVPVALLELLRGLLADDPKIRWTMSEVEQWLQSRHVVTRHAAAPKRPSRPFEFCGRPCTSPRALAHAFAGNPKAAAAAIRSSEFEVWTQRALGDEACANVIKHARSSLAGSAPSDKSDANLVARVCIALDPEGPIRYRGLAAMIDGFGGALAAAFLGHGPVQPIAEVIAQNIPQFLLTARTPPSPEHLQLFKVFERLRLHLDDRRPGFGLERLVYELAPTLHCLSPLLEHDCVSSLAAVLPVLERHAGSDFGGAFPIDRHCAAFAAARLKAVTTDWNDDLASGDATHRLLGALRLLARLQMLGGAVSAPALAAWMAKHAAPLVERYHHRPTRKLLATHVAAAAAAGKLPDLLFAIDNQEQASRDAVGFFGAVRAHAAINVELRRLAAESSRHEKMIEELAGQLAVLLASAASAVAVVIVSAVLLS